MDRRALALLLVMVAATPATADDKKAKQARAGIPAPAAVVTDSYDELFVRYLESARATTTTAGPNFTWMAGLNADQRARNVNDLVTVQVLESIVGTGTADSSLDKEGKAAAGVTQLLGAEAAMPSWLDPTNLVGAASKTDFKGGGSTTRTGTLTAVLTARVTEVLPNGDLVLEGAREIDINGDRQIVVLTGVVRTSSILQGNVVPSPAIGQLRIRYFGRGLIKDNLQPGWLIRALNKVF